MAKTKDQIYIDILSRAGDDSAKLESLINVMGIFTDQKVSALLNDDFSPKYTGTLSLSGMSVVAFSFMRGIYNVRSIPTVVGIARDTESRQKLMSRDETWQALLLHGDDLANFIDINGEFLTRILKRSTGLEPESIAAARDLAKHNYKALMSEIGQSVDDLTEEELEEAAEEYKEKFTPGFVESSLIPLAKDILSSASEDPIELGGAVNKLVGNFLVSSSNPMDTLALTEAILDASVHSKLADRLGSDVNIDRILSLVDRAYSVYPSVRENFASIGISSSLDLEEFMPLFKDVLQLGISSPENREVVFDAIKLFMSTDVAEAERSRIFSAIISKGSLFAEVFERHKEVLSKYLEKKMGIDSDFERKVIKEDIIPLAVRLIKAASKEPEKLSPVVANLMKELYPVDGSDVNHGKLLKLIFESSKNSDLGNILKEDQNVEAIINIFERYYDTTPSFKKLFNDMGISKEKLKNSRSALKVLLKHGLGKRQIREKLIDIIDNNSIQSLKPELADDYRKSMEFTFTKLGEVFSDPDIQRELLEGKNSEALTGLILPPLSKIEAANFFVSEDILAGSNEFVNELVRSFVRTPGQLTRFNRIIMPSSQEDLGKAVIELFAHDENLKVIFAKGGGASNSLSDIDLKRLQLIEMTKQAVLNATTKPSTIGPMTKDETEFREQMKVYLSFAAPLIVDIIANSSREGESSKASIDMQKLLRDVDHTINDNIELNKITKRLDEISDSKGASDIAEKTKLENKQKELLSLKSRHTPDLLSKGLNLLMSDKQAGIIEKSIPKLISEKRKELEEQLKFAIDENRDLGQLKAKHLLNLLEDPKLTKKVLQMAREYSEGNRFKAALSASKLLLTSSTFRKVANQIRKDYKPEALKKVETRRKRKSFKETELYRKAQRIFSTNKSRTLE